MITRILLLLTATIAATAQTGTAVPELAAFDRATLAALQNYKIPGASVAIAKDGKLVYARGFGVADLVSGEPVQPDSLFRIASVSKPITAMAVLKLVEEGKVSLDTKVLPFIGRKATGDARYNDITVRHLLQHSAGMDIFTWNLAPPFQAVPPSMPSGQTFRLRAATSSNSYLPTCLWPLPQALIMPTPTAATCSLPTSSRRPPGNPMRAICARRSSLLLVSAACSSLAVC